MAETSSDDLKKYLCAQFGGSAADWKRESKAKDAQGHTVRVFKNKATSQQVSITEEGKGQYRLTGSADAAFKVERDITYPHAVENDPDKIALGKKLAKMIVDMEYDEEEDDYITPTQEQMQEAGTALANQFVFSIHEDDMGLSPDGQPTLSITVTPEKYFKREGYAFDQHVGIEAILPAGAMEVMESAFAFEDARGVAKYTDVATLMRDMLARGFVYNLAYQKHMDRSADTPYADKIAAAMKPADAAPIKPAAPKQP